jgi:hypothetical protein
MHVLKDWRIYAAGTRRRAEPIHVSIAPFHENDEIDTCPNTFKYSLFNTQKNAESNRHVLKDWKKVPGERAEHIPVSIAPSCEINICPNTSK